MTAHFHFRLQSHKLPASPRPHSTATYLPPRLTARGNTDTFVWQEAADHPRICLPPRLTALGSDLADRKDILQRTVTYGNMPQVARTTFSHVSKIWPACDRRFCLNWARLAENFKRTRRPIVLMLSVTDATRGAFRTTETRSYDPDVLNTGEY